MTLRKGFAAAIVFVQKSRGQTQEDFSDISSCTYLSNLERAMKSSTLDKLEGHAPVLEVDSATLVVLAVMNQQKVGLNEVIGQIKQDIAALKKTVSTA